MKAISPSADALLGLYAVFSPLTFLPDSHTVCP